MNYLASAITLFLIMLGSASAGNTKIQRPSIANQTIPQNMKYFVFKCNGKQMSIPVHTQVVNGVSTNCCYYAGECMNCGHAASALCGGSEFITKGHIFTY